MENVYRKGRLLKTAVSLILAPCLQGRFPPGEISLEANGCFRRLPKSFHLILLVTPSSFRRGSGIRNSKSGGGGGTPL